MTAGVAAVSARLSIRELLLWLFFAAVALTAMRILFVGNAALFWFNINRLNVFVVGAFCVAGWRLLQYDINSPATRKDVTISALLLFMLTLAGLLPKTLGFGIYLFLLAIWLSSMDDPTRNLRASAIVMVALATNFLFAPVLFRCFMPLFVWADAFLVGHALQVLAPDVQWNASTFVRPDGTRKFGITLVGACSSFNNVSAAVLVHMAWAMVLRKHLTRLDGLAVLATISFATALNVARIVLTAQGRDSFAFWHGDGTSAATGAMVFVVVQNAALATAGFLTARWAAPRN